MKYTLEQLSYVVPAFSIGFLLLITSINVYLKIRRRFPATVNCWFCNENSKVPYINSNSWTCRKCDQFNGFDEDGDYNCDIPAQRNAKLNNLTFANIAPSLNGSVISDRSRSVNGLCQPCNRNQELKMQQLASFEPENEAYFDEEVEIYRAKLEQAYRLCPRCERHLKRALNKVKTNILGSKLKQIGAKGLNALDFGLNDKVNKRHVYQKRHLLARGLSAVLIVISLLHLYITCKHIHVTKEKLDAVLDSSATLTILTLLSYLSAMKIMMTHTIRRILSIPIVSTFTSTTQSTIECLYSFSGGDIWSIIDTDLLQKINTSNANNHVDYVSTVLLNVSGCFISTVLLYLNGLKFQPIITILLWCGSIIVPSLTQGVTDPTQLLIFDVFKFALAWLTMINSFVSLLKPSSNSLPLPEDNKNASYHRIDDSGSEISDVSDLATDLDISNYSNRSKRSVWDNSALLNSTIASSKAPSIASGLHSLHRSTHNISRRSINGFATQSRGSPSFESARSFHLDQEGSVFGERMNNSAFASTRDNFSRRSCMNPLSTTCSHADYADSTIRCSSRASMYEVPNDFERSISQVSISGDDKQSRRRAHAFGSSDQLRVPMPQRKPLICPSRLSINENAVGVNQSWVAGGYWNNTSPHKKSAFELNHSRMEHFAMETPLQISRTSSRSSGFESMPNSTVNNSRENSLCGDLEMDKTYVMGDRLTNAAVAPRLRHFNNSNAMHGISSLSIAGHSNRSSAASVCNSSFGSQRRLLASSTNSLQDFQIPTISASKAQINEQLAKNFDNFISFTNTMPMHSFQRGSLIKLNNCTNEEKHD